MVVLAGHLQDVLAEAVALVCPFEDGAELGAGGRELGYGEVVLGFGHGDGRTGFFGQLAGVAHVVDMLVADDDPLHRPAGQRPLEEGLPVFLRVLVVYAAIEDDPAVLAFQGVDVDVVEPKRKIEPHPVQVVGDLRHAAFLGGFKLGFLHRYPLDADDRRPGSRLL